MAVPKRTVRGAPGADRERVAECPSVMARDDATIKLGDVNRPGCVSIVIDRRKFLEEPSVRARRRKVPVSRVRWIDRRHETGSRLTSCGHHIELSRY